MEDFKNRVDLGGATAGSAVRFLQIYGEVLGPLHHEEAERPAEAQDHHQ